MKITFFSLGALCVVAAMLPGQSSAQAEHAKYPKYKLINLGTLGGPSSSHVFPAKTLNNRNQFIAQSETAASDPFCPDNCFTGDGFVSHPILRRPDGAVIDLGGPPPAKGGFPNKRNSGFPDWITYNGLITGIFENGLLDPLTGFPEFRAVLWRGDDAMDLGTLGGNSSQGISMNSRAQVVGVALNATPENQDFASFANAFVPAATQARAFLWENGTMRDLGTLGRGNDASASVINEAGQIFGFSYTNTKADKTNGVPTTHPFLWKDGHMRDLGTLGGKLALPGSLTFGPFGVLLNEDGDAVGTSTLAGENTFHAFLWTNETMIDLGTLGGDNSESLALNRQGDVVGRADIPPDSSFHHAFLWRKGAMRNLGVVSPCQNSTATSINSAGQIVGGMGACTDNPDGFGYFRGFIWQNGGPMVDLNTLVSPSSNINITEASYINGNGEIAAIGELPNGQERAILLVPQ
jgi:probable HAF family extracellular repeat protein